MNKMINKKNIGAFCEMYGITMDNYVLEYLLENQYLDFAVGDMAEELEISRPKAYEIIKKFEKKGYVKKTRIIGKTQLYILNKENIKIKLFMRNFDECLNLVIEEYSEEKKLEIGGSPHVGTVSARNV